ncbi:TPA: TorD/DmsD family molecular chaperone [Providencia rettgeri]
MISSTVLPRILGALFYYSPSRAETKKIFSCVTSMADLYPWRERSFIDQLCASWPSPDSDSLAWQFSVLFEGQGEMLIPPWGSVWLEKDNLLMGETTALYRGFLQSQGLIFNACQHEPEDQFGLMLLAYSSMLEAGNKVAANQLLEVHLLPWGYRYLELLQNNTISSFYAHLATLTSYYLQDVQHHQGLRLPKTQLFF